MALLFELVATLSFDMVHPGGVKEEAHLNSKKDVTKQASINEVCGSNSIALRYTVDVPLYPRPSGPRRSFSELCRERRFARACCLFALPPRNVMMQLDPPVPRSDFKKKAGSCRPQIDWWTRTKLRKKLKSFGMTPMNFNIFTTGLTWSFSDERTNAFRESPAANHPSQY